MCEDIAWQMSRSVYKIKVMTSMSYQTDGQKGHTGSQLQSICRKGLYKEYYRQTACREWICGEICDI